MDYLHHSGVDVVRYVQTSLAESKNAMLLMSKAGDPRNAFLIYFPLIYALSHHHGRRIMWAGVVSEWLNIVFKWVLFGHRPYWWVHEYKHYTADEMEQFHLTCETGPGSPSGHAMVTAAVFYIIADASSSRMPRFLPHLIFLIAMIPVNLARIFIAAHFPHQVIAGTICGIVIAVCLDKYTDVQHWHCKDYLKIAIGLFFSCIGFSWTLGQLGVDFHWTLSLANKWCKNPEEWVSLNTTPYNSLIRDVFILAGFGLAQLLARKLKIHKHRGLLFNASECILSVLAVNALELYHFAHTSMLSFYIFSAIKHTLIPFLVVFIIPFILSKFSSHHPVISYSHKTD
uniref:glucose-6-phosphatase 2-like n=1 Tax=Styela clava TaxID=7725 RepID=UPI0019394B72|nr:glucose-6-phosphatase 2-like [Styela clava]